MHGYGGPTVYISSSTQQSQFREFILNIHFQEYKNASAQKSEVGLFIIVKYHTGDWFSQRAG
jgi:hypothetical protein